MAEFEIDSPPDDDESPSQRRRRVRRSESTKSTDDPKPASDSKVEAALSRKLIEAFSKLASQLKAKGDDELGSAIEEESGGMTNGLMSLTRSVTFLRNPLVFAVELLLVLLAFWRVGRILLIRALMYRERMMEQQRQQEWPDEHDRPVNGPILPDDAVVAN